MKNSQKGFVIPLLIIIVAALIIGSGIYFYQKNISSIPPTVSVPTVSTTTIEVSSPAASTATSSSWQMYVGNTFSVTYPQGWTIKEEKPSDPTLENIVIFKAPGSSATGTSTSLSVDVWPIIKGVRDTPTVTKTFLRDKSLTESNVIIGNTPAVEFTGSNPIIGTNAFIDLDNGNYTYSIGVTWATSNTMFNQFYQSFKFK
jgi:hypothetical protein